MSMITLTTSTEDTKKEFTELCESLPPHIFSIMQDVCISMQAEKLLERYPLPENASIEHKELHSRLEGQKQFCSGIYGKMAFIPEHPNKENTKEFADSLGCDFYNHLSDHFRDLHSKEIIENFPLPAVPDGERVQLNEFLEAGCYDY